jgi:hypothetical protein
MAIKPGLIAELNPPRLPFSAGSADGSTEELFTHGRGRRPFEDNRIFEDFGADNALSGKDGVQAPADGFYFG